MNRFKCIAFFLLTLVVINVIAAEPPAQPKTETPQIQVTKSNQYTIEILKTEVQVLREFTQHILNTVYFSLGMLVVLTIAVWGINFFQNHQAYQRDREALHQSVSTFVAESLAKAKETLTLQLTQALKKHEDDNKSSFDHFDEKMAEVFGLAMQRISENNLQFVSELHRTTHAGPTPRTDLLLLITTIKESIGRVSPATLKNALAEVIRTLDLNPTMRQQYTTQLLELASKLPEEAAAYATQLKGFAETKH